MSAYTDATTIAGYLNVPFSPEQTTLADSIANAVTQWIDRRTGMSWQDMSGSVTGEISPVLSEAIFLAYVPIDAITKLELRRRGSGDAWAALQPDDYAIANPTTGRVEIPGAGDDMDARTEYASTATATPPDIALAATIIASYFMLPSLNPGTAGLSSLALGQNDISVKFASGGAASQSGDLAMARTIVDSYRRWVVA